MKDFVDDLLWRCGLGILLILDWVPILWPKCENEVYCLSVSVGGTGGCLCLDCEFLRGLFVAIKESLAG